MTAVRLRPHQSFELMTAARKFNHGFIPDSIQVSIGQCQYYVITLAYPNKEFSSPRVSGGANRWGYLRRIWDGRTVLRQMLIGEWSKIIGSLSLSSTFNGRRHLKATTVTLSQDLSVGSYDKNAAIERWFGRKRQSGHYRKKRERHTWQCIEKSGENATADWCIGWPSNCENFRGSNEENSWNGFWVLLGVRNATPGV